MSVGYHNGVYYKHGGVSTARKWVAFEDDRETIVGRFGTKREMMAFIDSRKGAKTMGAPSDRVVGVRDRLNEMIESIEGDDQESHVMRCCVAVAVEEMERWMYDGKYTPSVRPVDEPGRPAGSQSKAPADRVLDFELPYEDWPEDERMAFQRGELIVMVKAVRTRSGRGLKEGKAYVDHQKERYPGLWGYISRKK